MSDATPGAGERWLPVPEPGFEKLYEVSDRGRVRSLDRTVACRGGTRRVAGRLIRLWANRSGRPAVTLQGAGRQASVAVHLLVQRAFGLPPATEAPPDPGEPERWLPVRHFAGLYEVSDLGRVRSFHGGKGKGKRGGLLRPGVAGRTNIHLHVSLYKDRKRTVKLVHQLVMEAFVGLPPEGREVCHGPGGALDNRLVNLSYGTRSKNCGEDKRRDGTLIFGEGIKGSRLTEQIVTECRRRYAAGETTTVLAAEFGVEASTMSEAVTGGTWAWVPGAIPRGGRAYHRRGAAHPAAKLTPEVIQEILRRGAAGEYQRDIAARFGVSQSTVWRVIHGKTWAA